jgi:hypothetical protein
MKIFLISLFIIEFSFSLKQNEICKHNQEECKGTYNSQNIYNIECKKTKCEASHQFKCNQIYCTKNARSCIDFYNLNRPSFSILRLPQRKNSHSLSSKQIKDCKLKEYKLNEKDFCLTDKSCTLFKKKTKSSMINSDHSSTEMIICPCRGKLNYHCGFKYCTINNLACKHLSKLLIKNKSFNYFKKCMNANQTIRTFLF